jgi:hypothetical protein
MRWCLEHHHSLLFLPRCCTVAENTMRLDSDLAGDPLKKGDFADRRWHGWPKAAAC